MSQVIDQADELRKRAIELLLTERSAIDERLAMLGCGSGAVPQVKQRACRVCGGTDHDSRRCPQRNTNTPEPQG